MEEREGEDELKHKTFNFYIHGTWPGSVTHLIHCIQIMSCGNIMCSTVYCRLNGGNSLVWALVNLAHCLFCTI